MTTCHKTPPSLRLLLGACIALATCALTAPLASAQATRTWVSGVGDDANPGSRTAPCKTFAGAISKTAAGGAIGVIDPGGFGAVTITKSMTIDGEGTLASILASGTNAIVINAAATDVITIRNIDIKNAGGGVASPSGLHAIKILQAGEVNIVNCTFDEGTDLAVSVVTASTCRVNIKNSTISGFATGGIKAASSGAGKVAVTISKSSIINGGFGIAVGAGASAVVEDSVINGGDVGVLVNTAAAAGVASLSRSAVSDTTSGVRANGSGAVIRLSDSTITGNVTGVVSGGGGQVISSGNNRIQGNTTNGAPTSTVGLQ